MNGESRLSPVPAGTDEPLLRRLLAEGSGSFTAGLRPFLVSLGDQLFDLSTGRGMSGSERQAHYDALNVLKRESEEFQRRFETRLHADLVSLDKERLTPNPFLTEQESNKLGLIDFDEMDRKLAIEKIVAGLVEQHQTALECLTIRAATLAGITPLRAKTPFHPAYLLRAFADATDGITSDASVFIDAIEFFRDRYLSNLDKTYERINASFAEQGVEPDLEAEIQTHGSRLSSAEKRRPSDQRPQNPKPSSDESEDSAGAEASPAEAKPGEKAASKRDLEEMYDKVVRALDTARSAAQKNDEDGSTSAGQGRPDTPALEEPELLDALAELKTTASDEALASQPKLEQLLKNSIGRDEAALDADSVRRLGFVDSVFDTLENAYGISDSLAPAVSRLRIPLAHLSVQEPRFFAQPEHPAYRVVDRLSTLAGTDQQVSPALQKRVAEVVERLNQTFDTDTSAFANAQEDLDRLVAQRSGAIEKNIERLIAGLEGQERLAQAQDQVSEMLSQHISRSETPKAISDVVDSGWRKAMVQVALREGVGSIAWREEEALLADLQRLFERRLGGSLDFQDLRELRPRLQALSQRISDSNPGAHDHEATLQELYDELAGERPVTTTSFVQEAVSPRESLATRVERLPKLRRWLRRVQDLRVGTRMRYRDKDGNRRRMNLVWISKDRERFAFANEVGQKIADMTAVQLARQLSRGVSPTREIDRFGVIDRSVYNTLEQAQEALSRERTRDDVTNLINGPALMNQIRRCLRHAHSHDSEHAFLLIDIDNFSLVNEVFDETSGDQILSEFGEFLAGLNDAGVLSARIGDDDFGVLLSNRDLDDAREFADTLRSNIAAESFAIGEDKISFTISAGLVPILQSSTSDSELLEQARGALEIAKSQGRNQVTTFDEDQQDRRRYQIERDATQRRLEDAIATNTLTLRAQPIVQSAVAGNEGPSHYYEILLALRSNSGELTSPQDFIVTAERFGLASEVDRWVIHETFAWISELVDKQKFVPRLSINLSGASITSDEFLDFILEQISEYGVGTNRLCFEITETGSIENLHKAADFVRTLKNIGCMFSLDDFGTGLASHTYLKELPVDHVKIDGSFISDVNQNRTDFAMAKSITDLAHFLGQKTIAECVENLDVVPALREIGVDYLQGWGIGKPSLLSDIIDELPDIET